MSNSRHHERSWDDVFGVIQVDTPFSTWQDMALFRYP